MHLKMMKNFFFKTVSCLSLTALTAFAPTPTTQKAVLEQTAVPASNICFQHGEELTYKLYYNLNFVWVPAGEVTFKVSDEDSKFKIAAIGRSYASYDWFFKVRDNYYTDLDKTTMLPVRSVREVMEGGYRLYDAVTYDQKNKVAHYERGNSKTDIEKKGKLNLAGAMHDIISAIYYTRTMDFSQMSAGQTFPVKILLDENTYPLNVKYLGTEIKTIKDLGKYNTLKFSPQVVSGTVFKEGSQMKVYATNDANKMPLLIESPVSVGSVKAVLKSYKGLKYAMTAKQAK
jgi:Protein of unknown function (DUF3108)